MQKARWIVAVMLVLSSSIAGCKREEDSPKPAAAAAAPDVDAGSMLYAQGCMTCHGTTGQGLSRQGPELKRDPFIASHTDAELIDFLKKGRPIKDPTNKSGILMPAGGKIPGFGADPQSDNETLADVVAFLRHMQQQTKEHDAANGNTNVAPAPWPTTAPAVKQ